MGRLTCMILFSSFLGIWTPATGMSLKRTTAAFFALPLPRFSVESIKAERARAEVRDEEGAADPGQVRHEEPKLELRHHRIFHGPEVVHHPRHGHEEQDQQPRPELYPVPQNDAQPAE